jgi:hypothetical protein
MGGRDCGGRDVRPPGRAGKRDATTTTADPPCRDSPAPAVRSGRAASNGGRSNCGARERGRDLAGAEPAPLPPPGGTGSEAGGGGGGGRDPLSRAGAAGALPPRRERVSGWCGGETCRDEEYRRCCGGGRG